MHIVHTESSCGWGGQELRILEESTGMMARGHRVTLLAPPEAKIYVQAQRRGLSVVSLPMARKTLPALWAMRRWLGAHARDIDVINSHSSTDSWLVALACATLPEAPPVVRTRHISAPLPDNRATHWLYGRAAAHVVTTGETLRRHLIDEHGLPEAHLTSVPTGMDPQRYTPGDRDAARTALGLPTEKDLVGIVATLRSWKGHRHLVDAFAGLARDNTCLLIVGDGPQRAPLEEQVDALGLRARVRFAGNQEDVVPWLQAVDVFVLPSYANEGVPQALTQAMLCARACVTTPIGAIGELARDGETALVVPPRDPAALGAAIARLLDDPALRSRLGTGARAHALAHFSRESMLGAMESIFTVVANPREPRADA